MGSDSNTARPDPRRYVGVFAAQLVLVGAAILVSRLGLGTTVANASVLAIAALNAGIVGFLLMGVRRDGRYISLLVLVMAIFILGLLIWPAWDVYERPTVF